MEKAWDISTAVISTQVSEQATLQSTDLYRLPSTAQQHSVSFTSLLCALSPVKNNTKINKTLLFRTSLVPGLMQNMVKTQSDGLNRQQLSK
jgi:hypothetical protein